MAKRIIRFLVFQSFSPPPPPSQRLHVSEHSLSAISSASYAARLRCCQLESRIHTSTDSIRHIDRVDLRRLQQVDHSPFLADHTHMFTVQHLNCRYLQN